MKTPILVPLILLLGITLTTSTGQYQFGDIIAFERTCVGDKTVYKHYAIYVGPSTGIDVGQGDNDIYHLTGKGCMVSEAKFGKLNDVKKTSKVLKDNYLDDHGYKMKYDKGFEDQVKKRIGDTRGQWSFYRLFNNNCEQFATQIRYGVPSLQQKGTMAESVLKGKESATKVLENIAKHMTMETQCPFTDG
ncbi:phospholipase A and acyltransferase 3-like [Etheostoma cragini]|uniref:phospholipase A and acyltransferase 3-like n=1 Tax=Etheostoma cragini TaxID=417921 RepID=UPI00155F50FF|nr:phospholipase A and acyltransferase 3-like [Etheostoma cragini]